MNISNFAHAGLALVFQFLIGLVFYLLGFEFALIFGALFSIGFYLGREVAQYERKAGGKPWYVGFEIWNWTKDGVLDFVFPTVAVCVVAALEVWI